MDAMILAAGVGSRLGEEITRHIPKALVPIAGRTALERVAERLIRAGADRLIINVHHHAQQIVDFVAARHGFGVEVVFSEEPDAPLETGGGLLHAAPLFRVDAPFFLHNVDVLSDLDLAQLYAQHASSPALATLAVNQRPTSRLLLFSEDGLCGRLDRRGAARAEVHAPYSDDVRLVAFAGVHVISPAMLGLITERGAFSIIDAYLRLAAMGHLIAAWDIGDATWLEIGTPERLAAARQFFAHSEPAPA
ncbi:MAG TPA: NTP transferase domain-containing protein [Longimicrobiales bacterium]|nr:NTP transferase domain-containing protein [Longimicrobiales bacterium]